MRIIFINFTSRYYCYSGRAMKNQTVCNQLELATLPFHILHILIGPTYTRTKSTRLPDELRWPVLKLGKFKRGRFRDLSYATCIVESEISHHKSLDIHPIFQTFIISSSEEAIQSPIYHQRRRRTTRDFIQHPPVIHNIICWGERTCPVLHI